jgi:hypothetical protein
MLSKEMRSFATLDVAAKKPLSTPLPIAPSNASTTQPKGTAPRQAIALISDHGDPAADIGREEAGGYVYPQSPQR